MKKYNLSEIMHKAWKLYRKGVSSFAEALHRAWNSAKAAPVNAQRIEEAQQAAGVAEPVNTWAGWKAAGYMVEHGAKARFQAVLHRRYSRWKSSNTNRDPRREDGSPPGMMGGYDHEVGEENQLTRL